jgi:hypothetical protein
VTTYFVHIKRNLEEKTKGGIAKHFIYPGGGWNSIFRNLEWEFGQYRVIRVIMSNFREQLSE